MRIQPTSVQAGQTVYTSRTGSKAYTVLGTEVETAYPDSPPIVWARTAQGRETWLAMHEVWIAK